MAFAGTQANPSVNTTGNQYYQTALTLSQNTVLNAGSVDFLSTVNGAMSLLLNAAGNINLYGLVGSTAALSQFQTSGGGTLNLLATGASADPAINIASIRTTGAQLFGSSLVLGEDAFLSSTTRGDFIFLNTINSRLVNQPRSLTVVGQERIVLEALAGGTAKLKSASLNAVEQLAVNAGIQTFGGTINLTSTAGTVVLAGATDTTGDANLLGGAVILSGEDEVIFRGGTITTFGGAVGVTGPAFINTATTITTSGGGLGDGDVTFNQILNGFTPLTITAGTGALIFTDVVGGTNPFGMTVSSAGGIDFRESVTLGGNFNLSSEGTGVNFGGTLNGDYTVIINSSLGDISLGTVGDVIPIAGFSTSSGSGTLTLNGNISTEGGALNFGQEVSVTSDLTIRTGLGLSPQGASISFTKAVLPSVAGIDLTINPGSTGSVILADGLGSSSDRFSSFTLLQGGGISIGGIASGIFTSGEILILPKVFGSFPKSTVKFNSLNGSITLAQGAVLTGIFSGANDNSDGSNFVADALNGTVTINSLLDVSGGDNDTSTGGGSGYNSGAININAKNVVLNTLQALGGDAKTVGNGGTGGNITISSEESLSVNSILTDGGTGEKIVGGIGGDVNINRTGAVGEIFIGTISSRGGDSTDNFGGNGGDITITAALGDLYAPTSFFTNGGDGSDDAFAGLGGTVNLVASAGNISFQNQSLTLSGDGSINIVAGRSLVFATSADFTTPSKSSGGVVITFNQNALRTDRRGEISLQYGSANTAGELYMPSSAYLISNGGKVAVDVKNISGLAGAMTLSGITTSAADLNAGSIEINQNVGTVLGNVTISGSIDTNGGDPASTGPRYGRNGGSVLISGLAVSVQQIITTGSASLATATVPAFGGSGGDVTITGTSILIRAGTVPATGSFAINTSGGTGQGTGNANGGSGGNIQLNGNVTLDSGDASRTTIILNTQGGTFAGGASNGIGGDISVTGTLTGTKTTSNILDIRYGSGTVTLGDATADKITLGTLITAADDARSTGTLVINGLLVVDSLITYARGYSLSILGAGTEFSSLNTFLNTGTVGLGASGAGVTFEGGFNSSAAAFTQLNGLVNTGSAQSLGNGGNMVMGAVILAADSTLNSNGNDITLTTIDNDPDAILAKDLTFARGIGSTGSVTIAGAVGSTKAVDTVTVNSTGPVAFASSFNGGGIVTAAGTTTSFSGGTSIQDALNGITTTGVSSLNGTVTLVNSLYATDTTQVFTLTSSGAFSMPGTVTMSGGPFALAGTGGSFTVAGTLNGSQPLILSGTSTKTFSGSLTVGNGTTAIRGSGTGRATFSGTTTLKGASSFANPVTLSGSSVSASGATVMSDGLTLAGGGGTLGGTGAYTISSISGVGQGLTYSGSGSANLSGVINLGSITGSGSGTMTFGGAVTSANASSFVGLVKLGGDFTTASGTTSFNTIDLTGASTLGGNLKVNRALTGNNQSLTLEAGTQQFFSATGLGALTIQGGTTSFSSGLTGTSLSQTSGTLTLNGSTSFSSAATLAAGTTLNLNGISFSAGSVALAGTLNGSGNTIVSGSLTLGATGDLNSTTTGGLLSLKNGLVLQRDFSMDGAGNYSVSGFITRDGSARSLTFDGAGTKTFSANLGTSSSRLSTVSQAVGSGRVSFGGNVFSDGITMNAATLVNGTVEIDSNAATQSYQSITLAGSLTLQTNSSADNAVTLGSGGVNGTGDLTAKTSGLALNGVVANSGTFNAETSGLIDLGGAYLTATEAGRIQSSGGARFASSGGDVTATGVTMQTSLAMQALGGQTSIDGVNIKGALNMVSGGVVNFNGTDSTVSSLGFTGTRVSSDGTPNLLANIVVPSLGGITLTGGGNGLSYSPDGNLNVLGRISVNGAGIELAPSGNFVNSYAGNPFTANSTRILTKDLFSSWPSNGAVPGLQVVYGVNSIGQVGANQIGVSTTLLAGNAGPFILEFTTGTGQPYILAQQTAIPPVMLPAALTGGNGFARSVTYSPDEIEMMTPEERSAYENQQRQVSARVILQGQSGVGEEIGAPTEGRTPQAATPAALAPVAPTAQVLLEGKPLAGAKSDQERGDATKIIKLRPTRAVALRPSYRAADVMESERMAAEVSVGAAPVAQSR